MASVLSPHQQQRYELQTGERERERGVGRVFAPAVHSPGPAAARFFFLLVWSVAALHTVQRIHASPFALEIDNGGYL